MTDGQDGIMGYGGPKPCRPGVNSSCGSLVRRFGSVFGSRIGAVTEDGGAELAGAWLRVWSDARAHLGAHAMGMPGPFARPTEPSEVEHG